MNQITSFKQIKEIIEPIPEDQFVIGEFGTSDGKSCFLGHIHRNISGNSNNYNGDRNGFGARDLTSQMLHEVHNTVLGWIDGADVNNGLNINGYAQPIIKDRLMAMIEDGIKWEESKIKE